MHLLVKAASERQLLEGFVPRLEAGSSSHPAWLGHAMTAAVPASATPIHPGCSAPWCSAAPHRNAILYLSMLQSHRWDSPSGVCAWGIALQSCSKVTWAAAVFYLSVSSAAAQGGHICLSPPFRSI